MTIHSSATSFLITSQSYLPRANTGEGQALARLEREQKQFKDEIKKIQKKMLNARNMLSVKDVYRQQAKMDVLEFKIDRIQNEMHQLQEG